MIALLLRLRLRSVSIPGEKTMRRPCASSSSRNVTSTQRWAGYPHGSTGDAETALMAWALAIVKTLPQYDEEFTPIFTTPLLSIRTRAIEIALKLEVPEEN
jgi:hypothetical protein